MIFYYHLRMILQIMKLKINLDLKTIFGKMMRRKMKVVMTAMKMKRMVEFNSFIRYSLLWVELLYDFSSMFVNYLTFKNNCRTFTYYLSFRIHVFFFLFFVMTLNEAMLLVMLFLRCILYIVVEKFTCMLQVHCNNIVHCNMYHYQ